MQLQKGLWTAPVISLPPIPPLGVSYGADGEGITYGIAFGTRCGAEES